MTSIQLTLPADFWQSLKITKQDIELLHNHLFEVETPLTGKELVAVLVVERIRAEQEAALKQKQAGGKIYLPKATYKKGEELVFPALNWEKGKVTVVRPGSNPEIGQFSVLTVLMDSGAERLFAADLAQHCLNEASDVTAAGDQFDPAAVMSTYAAGLEAKLDAALQADEGLVRIAGRWFPRALLVDVNVGHLNLAEAVLDVAGGEPLPTSALLKDAGLPGGVNPKLAEFSLNYAMQEDGRFDEVGPAGEVLWCLERWEPEEVRRTPPPLRYTPIEHDRSVLTRDMLALEVELDDELSDVEAVPAGKSANEVTISLIYPHWRAGTLPVSARVRSFFPTAYVSPRIRFTLVDGKSGKTMPGWVMRDNHYVSGLRDWFKVQELMPGSLIRVRRAEQPGEVIVTAQTHRANREWMRTVIVAADGGLVFALLKQMVSADFNERMALVVSDVDAVDQIWAQMAKSRQPFEALVTKIMRELTKDNLQGHVHAQELYSAVNIFRRCPPAPLFALLATRPCFTHVGDLHFRLDESALQEK